MIKGPSAAIYGEATPGGTLNIVTKEPNPTSTQSVDLYAGSYRTQDLSVQLTGTVAPNTTFIVDVGEYARSQTVAFAENRNEELYIAVAHSFDSTSRFEFKFDYYQNALDATIQIIPYDYDSVNKVYNGNLATFLGNVSRTGPDAYPKNRVNVPNPYKQGAS